MISKWKKIYQNNKFLIAKIFKYNKPLFFIRIISSFLSSLSVMIGVLLPKYLLEALFDNDLKRVIYILGIYGVLVLVLEVADAVYSNYNWLSSEKMYVKIINEFLNKGISLDMSFYDDSDSYSKYSRGFGNCCNVISNCNQAILSVITAVMQIVMISSVLLWSDYVVFIAVLLFVGLNVLINNKRKKIDYDFSVRLSEKNKQVNYLYRLFYTPQFIREIKANVMEDFVFGKKQAVNDEILVECRKKAWKDIKYGLLNSILERAEYILAALYFAFSVFYQIIKVTDYFTSLNAYLKIKEAINDLLSSYTTFYNNSLFADDYIDFMKSDSDVTTNAEGIAIEAEDIQSIEFKKVEFRYPNSETNALEQVSFRINKNDKIAIVGKNGAGKTTIIKLLLRLYDPQSGEILLNGINLKEYNTYSLRTAVRTLFQDFAVYAFSVQENVTLGKAIDEKKVIDALEQVELYDKVQGLSQGMNTPITSQLYKGGVELSGGETQKIAISRIFAALPSFFVLDEPTSSLDPYAEYRLYHNLLERSHSDNTFIVISHRLTLTHKMSKIIVLDRGSVIEMGTHERLMENNGVYADMYRLQAEKFADGAEVSKGKNGEENGT